MENDRLVKAIFDAIRHESAESSRQRQYAIIRAGKIAEAYLGMKEDLLDKMFGSGPLSPLKDGVKRNDYSGL